MYCPTTTRRRYLSDDLVHSEWCVCTRHARLEKVCIPTGDANQWVHDDELRSWRVTRQVKDDNNVVGH